MPPRRSSRLTGAELCSLSASSQRRGRHGRSSETCRAFGSVFTRRGGAWGEAVGGSGGVKRENVVGRGSNPCGTPCACREGWIKQHDTHHLLLRLSLLLSAFPSATAALRGVTGEQIAASLPLSSSCKNAACIPDTFSLCSFLKKAKINK